MGLIKFIINLFSSGRSGTLSEDDPEFRRLLEFDNTSVGSGKGARPSPGKDQEGSGAKDD